MSNPAISTNHKQSQAILYHLENELPETFKVSKTEAISLGMEGITMDFNELQKRISDMTNPDFWLQKALQKQRLNSVIAIEGAIDYYKQGLRIVSTLLFMINEESSKREVALQYSLLLREDWQV